MKVFSQISVIWWPSRAALKDLLGNHEGAVQILGVLAALTVLCLPWSQTVMTYWLCWIKILPDQTKPTSTYMSYLPTWPTQWVVPTCWSTHLIYLLDYADDRDYADSADNDLHVHVPTWPTHLHYNWDRAVPQFLRFLWILEHEHCWWWCCLSKDLRSHSSSSEVILPPLSVEMVIWFWWQW